MADQGEDEVYHFRRAQEFAGHAPLRPACPAVVLIQPKYSHNVGQAVRIASCYGISQIWYSGTRVKLVSAGERLPREERMKGYADVTLVNDPDPLEALLRASPDATPVAIELRPGAEPLPTFEHPERAIYVFGPEDGSLRGPVLKRCHRFVVIPTAHCLNLATSIGTVLYDRAAKAGAALSVAGEARVRL
jgi:tRNA(Leu) C34 or U34 (ribose-2'-O)-methylase TrmL